MEAPQQYKNALDEGRKQTRRQQAETLAVLVKLFKHDKDLEAVTHEITSKENRLITIKMQIWNVSKGKRRKGINTQIRRFNGKPNT